MTFDVSFPFNVESVFVVERPTELLCNSYLTPSVDPRAVSEDLPAKASVALVCKLTTLHSAGTVRRAQQDSLDCWTLQNMALANYISY